MFADLDLEPINTLRVPARAGRAVVTSTAAGLRAALLALPEDDRRWARVVGELSNTVLGDKVDEPLIVFRDGGIVAVDESGDEVLVRAEGSCPLDAVVAATADLGLYGMEMLSGIPGTVGAGLVQNVGAYGQEIAPVVEWVSAVERASGELRRLAPEDLGFGYRTSVLKRVPHPPFDIAEVALRLSRRPAPMRYGDVARHHEQLGRDADDPAARRASVLEVRARKGFVVGGENWVPCNGSTFMKTPIAAGRAREIAAHAPDSRLARRIDDWLRPGEGRTALPAGLALLAAGFRNGDRWGPVCLGERHVLAICNLGGAAGTLVWALGEHLRATVAARLGVELSYEVEFLGRPPGRPAAEILGGHEFEPGHGDPEWVEHLTEG